uniref:C2H2-type domain-containing protein n=1 Tax=Hucho hucho TaxID=62062 RepID=A0A4W5K977_9TELE
MFGRIENEDSIDTKVGFSPGSLFSSFTSQDREAKLTFTFIPHQILLNKDHEFFEDGDIHRHLYLQNLSTCPVYDSPTARQCEFRCHISGCSQVFSTVEEYEHHYNTLHRHMCSSCQRSLPSARLLDIHIQEWHDSLFSILAERQDMYQCLVEGCSLKFRTREQRKDHMIKIHQYPSDFMFDKAKRIKKINIANKNRQQKGTSMEVSMSGSEPEDVCQVLSDQPEEEEYMELNHSLEPAHHKPTETTAQQRETLLQVSIYFKSQMAHYFLHGAPHDSNVFPLDLQSMCNDPECIH